MLLAGLRLGRSCTKSLRSNQFLLLTTFAFNLCVDISISTVLNPDSSLLCISTRSVFISKLLINLFLLVVEPIPKLAQHLDSFSIRSAWMNLHVLLLLCPYIGHEWRQRSFRRLTFWRVILFFDWCGSEFLFPFLSEHPRYLVLVLRNQRLSLNQLHQALLTKFLELFVWRRVLFDVGGRGRLNLLRVWRSLFANVVRVQTKLVELLI